MTTHLIPALFIALLAGGAPASAQDGPPPEASSQLSVELAWFTCDVWGGDGEGLPAVWDVIVVLRVHNRSDEAVRLEGASWTLYLGEERIEGRYRGKPRVVPAGAWFDVHTDRYITVEQLQLLREGVRRASRRSPRRLAGQVDFAIDEKARYPPFTVVGTFHGLSEQSEADG